MISEFSYFLVTVLYGNDLNVIKSYRKGTICVQATLVLDMSKAAAIIAAFKRYLKEVGVFVVLPKDPVILLGMAYGVAVGDGHCSSYADVLEFYQDCSVRDEYLEDKILSMSDEGYEYPDFDEFVAASVVSGCGGGAGSGSAEVSSSGEVTSRLENVALGSCVCRFEHLGVGRGFVGRGFVGHSCGCGCGCMMGVF